MDKETFGQSLKRKIDTDETHLEWLSIKYGYNSSEYQSFAQKLEAKRKYVENIEGHTPKEAGR